MGGNFAPEYAVRTGIDDITGFIPSFLPVRWRSVILKYTLLTDKKTSTHYRCLLYFIPDFYEYNNSNYEFAI